jgi:hypothetical protein
VNALVVIALAAWQSFATSPFRETFSGHTRALWAKGPPEPAWVADTFAGLSLASYDGKTLAGEVDLWAGAGLDVRKCAAEVVYDVRGKRGVRFERPTRIEDGRHALWTFHAEIDGAPPPVLAATAFVFCPIDAAHVTPPWGATLMSIEMVIAGPHAKDTYCKQLGASDTALGIGSPAGKHTFDLGFACGVMPRVRGHDLVDDCHGDVLVSLDALGTTASAPATGGALTDEELRHFVAGSAECARVALSGFGPHADAVWRAAVKRMGKRLLFAFSRDGMIQP